MIQELILATLILAILIFTYIIQNFYRDPKRKIPKGNVIVSPADGKVIRIEKTTAKAKTIPKGAVGKIHTLTKDVAKECIVVSIFMSPFNVHYNRAPIAGKIISQTYTKGKFYNAKDLNKSLLNEKNEIIIQFGKTKVKVIQIAGFLARRVYSFVKVNQKVDKGQKIGFISLGSQATVILPSSAKITCRLNQKVRAGSSIIGQVK